MLRLLRLLGTARRAQGDKAQSSQCQRRAKMRVEPRPDLPDLRLPWACTLSSLNLLDVLLGCLKMSEVQFCTAAQAFFLIPKRQESRACD